MRRRSVTGDRFRGQLSHLLDDALFEPVAWSRALYAPPWRWASGRSLENAWENAGEKLWSGLGGVILVEAVKRQCAAAQAVLRVLPRALLKNVPTPRYLGSRYLLTCVRERRFP